MIQSCLAEAVIGCGDVTIVSQPLSFSRYVSLTLCRSWGRDDGCSQGTCLAEAVGDVVELERAAAVGVQELCVCEREREREEKRERERERERERK